MKIKEFGLINPWIRHCNTMWTWSRAGSTFTSQNSSPTTVFIVLVTGRNEVVAKVIFLHLFVILFTRGGWYPTRHWGRTPLPTGADPPGPGTPPPQTKHTPPDQTHPPRPGTPPPPEQTPPDQPPPGSRLQHTVYERPVCILLECILVFWYSNTLMWKHLKSSNVQLVFVAHCIGKSNASPPSRSKFFHFDAVFGKNFTK